MQNNPFTFSEEEKKAYISYAVLKRKKSELTRKLKLIEKDMDSQEEKFSKAFPKNHSTVRLGDNVLIVKNTYKVPARQVVAENAGQVIILSKGYSVTGYQERIEST